MLRVALLAALLSALYWSLRPTTASSTSRSLRASALSGELDGLVADPAVKAVDVTIDAMPTHADRDLLVAFRRSGALVRWHGAPPALAMETMRVREPDARTRVLIAATGGAAIMIADSAGTLDIVRATSGATLDAATVVGSMQARHGAFVASASSQAETPQRAALVLGRADWESKFVMAAMGEAGWVVRGSVPIAPTVVVRDDGLLPLDTSRYDVVIALDSSAMDLAPAIVKFVAQGGGLVASGDALRLNPIRALAPARPGDRLPGRILLAEDSVRPRDLPLRPLTVARDDAITVERQSAGATLAARRAGLGRVLAVGYDESWRWRMLGGETGHAAHRRWWSAAAGSVARERADAQLTGGDAAPLASLVAALGESSPAGVTSAPRRHDLLPLLLLILMCSCLLAETASRRFRGAR